MAHPMGVRPWGSYFMSSGDGRDDKRDVLPPVRRRQGLGSLAALEDHTLLMVLGYLDARDLCNLAATSQTMYAFAFHEDIWRALALRASEGVLQFRFSWRETYARWSNPSQFRPRSSDQALRPRVLRSVFSDVLYEPWMYAHREIDPAWLDVDNMPRIAAKDVEGFRERFEARNRPVVIEGATRDWPALRKWTDGYLGKAFRGKPVIVSNAPTTWDEYKRYLQENRDEQPLYLFDKTFAETAPELAADFQVPRVFSEDLFSLLSDRRPDYRWLIVGGQRSGSSFHVDPNGTSAWNAPVRGRKKWVLYPPNHTPPGVRVSEGGATVATPLSLMEWFDKFYVETKKGPVRPFECICSPGDVVFVPSGWWHCVMNIDPGTSIAVTQNFVSSANLDRVMRVLETRDPDLVSGCPESDRPLLCDWLMSAINERDPDAWARNAAVRERRAEEVRGRAPKLASLFAGGGASGVGARANGGGERGGGGSGEGGAGRGGEGEGEGGVGAGDVGREGGEGARDREGLGEGGGGGFRFGFESGGGGGSASGIAKGSEEGEGGADVFRFGFGDTCANGGCGGSGVGGSDVARGDGADNGEGAGRKQGAGRKRASGTKRARGQSGND